MRKYWGIFGSLVLIVMVGGVIYSNTLEVPLTFDDANVIAARAENRYVDMTLWDGVSGRRSLALWTFGLNFKRSGLEVRAYHLVNTVLHLIASMVVFWLAWILAGMGKNRLWVALVAALIFVAHPIQTEGVTYISQRSGLLAAMFYLLALAAYCQWRAGVKRWWWLVLMMASAVLAFRSKETSVTLPLAIFLIEMMFFKKDWFQKKWRKTIIALAILVAVMIPAYIVGVFHGDVIPKEVKEAYSENYVTREQFAMTQMVVKARYLRLIALPFGQSVDHEARVITNWADGGLIWSVILLMGLLLLASWLLKRGYKLMAFGIFFWFIALLPTSSIYPLTEMMVEYRLYLPMTGVALVAGGLVRFILYKWKRRDATAVILVGLVVFLAGAAYTRNGLWRDPVRLWASAAERAENKARPVVNWGVELLREGRFDEAKAAFERAEEVDPSYWLTHHNLGALYKDKGNLGKAIVHYERAIELWPDNAIARFDLSQIFLAVERKDEAVVHLEKSAELGLKAAQVVLDNL